MIIFWDRANSPIEDVLEWARLFEDPGYRFVALDVEGARRVSTIWQGMDMSRSLRATAETAWVFETGFFEGEMLQDAFISITEEGALRMHDEVCKKLLGRPARPEDGHLQGAIDLYRRF